MTLWDQLPQAVRGSGTLDQLRPLLQSLNGTHVGERTDGDGTWDVWTGSGTWPGPVAFDPGTRGFGAGAGSSSTPIEFPDPTVGIELGLHLTATGGSMDGGWRVVLSVPICLVRLPFLRGAELDGRGQLRANGLPVTFTLPALRVQAKQLAGGSVGVELLSATTGGAAVDQIYEMIEMSPPYALIGPENVVGFAFRTAVLDLSGTGGPSGVPPEARAMPADWQGLWLPEARLFVSPSGLEGIAVSAGVRNLWIGLGAHAGVTGILEAEVVNRGSAPVISVHFLTATGEWVGDPGSGAAQLPESSTMFVDTAGGIAPVALTIDGSANPGARLDVTAPATGSRDIIVTATDGGSHVTTRTVSVSRRAAAVPATGGATSVTVTPTSHRTHTIVLRSQTTTATVLALQPEAAADWSWPGGSATSATTATVPVAAAAQVDVTATLAAAAPAVVECFFLFDRPPAPTSPQAAQQWALNPANSHTGPAGDRNRPGASPTLKPTLPDRLADIGASTKLTLQGYASYEDHDDSATRLHNQALSERRRAALRGLLTEAGFSNLVDAPCRGHEMARDHVAIDAQTPAPPPGDPAWWRARAVTDGSSAETVTARVRRPAVPARSAVDPRPPQPRRPDCFRKIGVRVELVRSTVIRAEVYGEFDIETAAESGLARRGQPALRQGPRPNPMDGVCTFLARLRLATDQQSWAVSAEFRAAEGDLDGLAMMTQGQANQTALDVLGALTVLAPLSSATAELSPAAGTLVALGTLTLGASDLIRTRSLMLRGGELVVSQGILSPDGSTTASNRGTQVSVLLDLETTFTFDLGIVRVNPAHPITTRYKAVGVRSSWNEVPSGAQVDYLPVPVFDPSRGYSLDIPAGAISASPPLDEILRILGVRVSRDNPAYLEVEVGLGLDLGIVTVDTVRVRARVDGPPLELSLTKLGASIEVPGTLHGSGVLEFTPFGFKGFFDLTVVPLNIRASASLAVETKNGVTGVLIGAEVEFPVPLLLGNSGLGIYGFLGGVGVNYARNEQPYAGQAVPSLGWLADQLGRGNVMHPDGWQVEAGAYAFAAGVLLGTVDGGFVVHLKGLVMIEVPGPRLLIVMKADVLKMPPVLKDRNDTASFLAVLDIDFGRGTISLGIVASYEIKALLRVRVPVTAFFNTRDPQNWLVDLGTYTDRVTVEVLDVISGSGYLMVHGDGISGIAGLPAVSGGLAIATGFHISAVLMGSKSVGLYLEVAAGFDAILGFDPFFLAGTIYARGELRLFIISIGASAELDVLVGRVTQTSPDVTYVHGEVCGKVDFFFFSIKGCVSLTIGSKPAETLTPPSLVAGVSLVSRSPALVEGTATNRAVDGKLADAVDQDGPTPQPALPSVPLDAVPVVLFSTAPTGSGPVVMGQVAHGSPVAPANPWVRLGDRWWVYELVTVTLTGDLQPPPPAGRTPSTWWTAAPPADPASGPALALLNWLPTPFSRAVPYGETLTTSVTDRWGTVCEPAAPPAPVLWSFDGKPRGPSTTGWRLVGIPWPDPPHTLRTSPVEGRCRVTEPWRCGDPVTDMMHGTGPAVVIGDTVPCPDDQPAGSGSDPLKAWRAGSPLTFSHRGLYDDGQAWDEVAGHLAAGSSLTDVSALRLAAGWDPSTSRLPFDCEGRILRSPVRDLPDPAPWGSTQDRDRVEGDWKRRKYRPDNLGDAVRITPQAGVSWIELLLMVPEEIFVERLVVRYEDSQGTVLAERAVTGTDRVGPANPVPPEWFDATGPWADRVERAGRIAARVAEGAGWSQTLVLVRGVDVPGDVASVVVGWDRRAFAEDEPVQAFHVVAMAGLVSSEGRRHSYDSHVVTSQQDVLSAVLTQDPDDHALLVPGRTYTVEVTWRAASLESDDQPVATTTPAFGADVTQRYRFTADPASRSPKDLSPWLLASAPGMDDTGVFCREPLRIAFATQKVATLFAAYGRELRIVVHAASGKHPVPPGGGAPGDAFVVPLAPDGTFLKAATALTVLTPWEEAVTEIASDLPCIPPGTRTHHEVLELPYDLDPLTDYLLDVHAVVAGAATSVSTLVHRVGFTTSRFDDVAHLAQLVSQTSWEHRAVPTPGYLTDPSMLPEHPTGDQLDTAFQKAGLAPPQTPTVPAVQVLWSAATLPEPVAVVVECSERLWRSRLMPTSVPGPADAADATHKWWAARPAEWLSVKDSATAPAAGDLPRAGITRLVHGPGGTRAVVVLAPGSRGREVRLDLVVAADPLGASAEVRARAVGIPLHRAPWEVDE